MSWLLWAGYAGGLHGCSYVTQDIDDCRICGRENVLALQTALADVRPLHRMARGRKPLELMAESASQFKDLYLDTDLRRLDCLSAIEGLGDFRQVKQASELFEVEGMRLEVLSLDALIVTRKAMNRPLDRELLRYIEVLKGLKESRL